MKFNTLIDEGARSADKISLQENTVVIGVYNTQSNNAYKGTDFSSRFQVKYTLENQSLIPITGAMVDEPDPMPTSSASTASTASPASVESVPEMNIESSEPVSTKRAHDEIEYSTESSAESKSSSLSVESSHAMADEAGETPDRVTIEFYDESYWRGNLLGYWQLTEGDLIFIKSDFLKALSDGITHFIFSNSPSSEHLFHFIEKANVLSGFFYNNTWQTISTPLSFDKRYGFQYQMFLPKITLNKDILCDFSDDSHPLNKGLDTFFGHEQKIDYRKLG